MDLLTVACPCGVVFERWVTLVDATVDLAQSGAESGEAQLKPLRVLTIALLFVLNASAIWAADLPVSVVSLSSPAARSTDARLEIQTTPGASCSIIVHYMSGPSQAKGLVPKLADGKGRVVWQWRVESNITPGKWPINVSCRKGEERGELQTAFEVR